MMADLTRQMKNRFSEYDVKPHDEQFVSASTPQMINKPLASILGVILMLLLAGCASWWENHATIGERGAADFPGYKLKHSGPSMDRPSSPLP